MPVKRKSNRVGIPKRYPHLLMTMLTTTSTAPMKNMFSGVKAIFSEYK
jgi:hypothetical protein